jgi:hypothetical protein
MEIKKVWKKNLTTKSRREILAKKSLWEKWQILEKEYKPAKIPATKVDELIKEKQKQFVDECKQTPRFLNQS